MNSELVYRQARRFISNHDHKLENVFVHQWEADLFSVTSSKYAYELEVKISRSDFLADFKKPKHNLFKAYKRGFGILRGDSGWHSDWQSRYSELINYHVEYTNIQAVQLCHRTTPNKFFYCVPDKLISLDEIPEYAGLIYCSNTDFKIIKKAPFLHKDEFDVKTMLFDKYYWKVKQYDFEISNRDYKIAQLENKLKKLQWEATVL